MRARHILISLAATGVAAALAIWEGCSVYSSDLLIGGADSGQPGPDSGGDDGATADADMCGHAHWPARPSSDSNGPGSIEFYNALSYLDFGVDDAGSPPVYGYDLDGVCTCPGPESCKVGPTEKTHCDQTGGVDNSAQQIILQFSQYPGFWDSAYINKRIRQGYYGALLRVRNYNGGPDDVSVEVAIFSSNGTEGVQTGAPAYPQYNGNDHWTIDPDSLLGGTIPDGGEPIPRDAVDVNAYVSGGVLVANLDVPLSVGSGNGDSVITVSLTGSVFTGTLTPTKAGYLIDDGIIAGRWATRKMLTTLSVLHDPFDLSKFLCGTDAIYQGIKSQICVYPDLTTNVLDDNKGAPCDAVSMALAFQSRPAAVGSVFAKPDAGFPCGPQWTDDCQ